MINACIFVFCCVYACVLMLVLLCLCFLLCLCLLCLWQFLAESSQTRITFDQWDSFLQFNDQVALDLSNYEDDGACKLSICLSVCLPFFFPFYILSSCTTSGLMYCTVLLWYGAILYTDVLCSDTVFLSSVAMPCCCGWMLWLLRSRNFCLFSWLLTSLIHEQTYDIICTCVEYHILCSMSWS